METVTVADLKEVFRERPRDSHKGTYGYIALIGGSFRYSGAIRLAHMANCAMRSGAGVVRIGAPRGICSTIRSDVLESTLFPLSDSDGDLVFIADEMKELTCGTRAAAFGMGIGNGEETEKALSWLLKNYPGRLIIDADGLNALARTDRSILRAAAGRVVLTPHPGEFSRLTGKPIRELLTDPAGEAEAYARETGATVLLKGAYTTVTDGKKTLRIDRGCAGMATAGSGDVLSGILAAVCAWEGNLLRAAAAAAWINGRAGELAQQRYGDISMVAGDTAAQIPEVIKEIRSAE